MYLAIRVCSSSQGKLQVPMELFSVEGSGAMVWPTMLTLSAYEAQGIRTDIHGLPPTLANLMA